MSVKTLQQEIVSTMKEWQKLESASIASTGRIIAETEDPVIRAVMEIIQQDSHLHYRVQGLIAESLEQKAPALTPDSLAKVWEMVARHIALENRMMEAVTLALGRIKGKRMVIQEYLLRYLLEDEKKHAGLLEHLETIKKGMLP
jgi:hypothetical protein